jgi:type II secretory pathway pseudopilin PulG
MSSKRGFTVLEAAVAIAIVGMISIAALAAFSGDLRAAHRAGELLPAAALAEDRLASLELAPPAWLTMLPDSLARGRFAAPFAGHEWTASAKPVRGERHLYDLAVTVRWEGGAYSLARRRYRPPPVGVTP